MSKKATNKLVPLAFTLTAMVYLAGCVESTRWNVSGERISGPTSSEKIVKCGIDDRPDRGKNGVFAITSWDSEVLANTKPPVKKLKAALAFYPDRELGLFYTQVFDSATRKPMYRRYGDRFLSFKSIARTGWNFQNFLSITLNDGKKDIQLRRDFLLSSLVVIEPEGERAVADFVFKLKGEKNFAGIRCVNYAAKPTWLFCELYLIGDGYSFSKVSLSSFGGYVGPLYPYRKIWFAGLSTDSQMNKTNKALDMKEYESLLIHQKNSRGGRGSLAMFDVDSLVEMRTGYRGGGVRLIPKKGGRFVRFAISDYNQPDELAISEMRSRHVEFKRFFQNIDWNANLPSALRYAYKIRDAIGGEYLATPAGKKFLANLAAMKSLEESQNIKGRMREILFGKRLTSCLDERQKVCAEAAVCLVKGENSK